MIPLNHKLPQINSLNYAERVGMKTEYLPSDRKGMGMGGNENGSNGKWEWE